MIPAVSPALQTPGARPLIMGVVNVTPDSFSDGGRWFEPAAAIEHGTLLLEQGADLLDIGGESTRPGAARPTEEEELDRVGIELNPGAAALARQNLADNGLAGEILPGDLRDRTLLAGDRFHLVVSNPPYFRAGSGKSGGQARMDETCSVTDLCQAAGRLARTGGRFALVYRPERLAELFAALAAARLEPKRMQLLAYDRRKPPYAVLVEAVKDGGPGLEVLPVHYQMEP